MQELREQAKTNVDSIVATVAGILSVVALIIAIGAMARTPEPDALTRAEAQEMIDSAVMRVADPAAYTQRVVQEAIDRYDAEGREASIAYHSSRESIDGPWYVFLLDENGYVLANPARPDFVGTTPAVRSDITGKPYGLEVVAADEDGRWVDYVFVNPSTGEPERKHTWVIKHDGLSFASGWYEPISREDDPATYTQAFVARAVSRYETEGREATLAYYSSSESVDGQWYVYIFDEDGRAIAHSDPNALGQNLNGSLGTDITGRVFGAELLAANADGLWVDYVFLNPATGQQATKHAWAVRHDGLLMGRGGTSEDERTAVVMPEGGVNVREPRGTSCPRDRGSSYRREGWELEDGNWVRVLEVRLGVGRRARCGWRASRR